MRRRAIIVTFLAVASLAWSAPAKGDVYEGTAEYKPPEQPMSLTPEPPIAQQGLFVHYFGVRYDSSAGIVGVFLGYYEPTYWAPKLQSGMGLAVSIPFALAETCEAAMIAVGPARPAGTVWLSGLVSATGGEVERAKYRGSVTAGATLNSNGVYELSFSNPNFAGIAGACLAFEYHGERASLKLLDQSRPVAPTPTPIRVAHASASLVRLLTAAADAHHSGGFTSRRYFLANAKVTSNGWASAEVHSRKGVPQRNMNIVFRLSRHRWRVAAFGTAFKPTAVPPAVQRALGV